MEMNGHDGHQAVELCFGVNPMEHVDEHLLAETPLGNQQLRSRSLPENKTMTDPLDIEVRGTCGTPVRTCTPEQLKDLHVRIPREAWKRAQIAALQSGVSFKDYLAQVMFRAKPLDAVTEESVNNWEQQDDRVIDNAGQSKRLLVQPAFETRRLRAFAIDCEPSLYNTTRTVIVAFLKEEDCGHAVVIATIWATTSPPFNKHYVEWLETMALRRRQGLAAELWFGMENYFGRDLSADAVTSDGKSLLEYIERLRDDVSQ